ncbi:beta-1,3-galactosyltransferase 2-like [Discoglossus pictus]
MALPKIPVPSRKTLCIFFIYVFITISLVTLCLFYIKVNFNYQKYKLMARESLQEAYKGGLPSRENLQIAVKMIVEEYFETEMPTMDHLDIRSYPYLLNEPVKCKKKTPFLILLIATVARDVEHRQAIRMTWGNVVNESGVPIVRLFMLGMDKTANQTAILNESLKYHDIIQKDFQDTYKNLTIKTIMGMEWVTTYCPKAMYVMKTDSDMFVNTELLLKLLQPELPPKQNFFTGFVMRNSQPHRDRRSKWHMPPSIYPEEVYPDFCSGTGYVFSADLASRIFRSSFHIKYLYLEDVFVGLCLRKERVPITSQSLDTLFNNFHVRFEPCTYINIITSHELTPSEQIDYWNIINYFKSIC